MTLHRLLSNPLLVKEMASQARRPGRPGWSYPGPSWFLLATLVPAVLFMGEAPPEKARYFFLAAAMFQLWLVAFRSSLYTSTSMASEVSRGTLSVMLSSPLALAGALAAKMAGCLMPLWLELVAALPLALGLYSGRGDVSVSLILTVTLFQLAVSLFCGGLGLWLGGLFGEPERAARGSRAVVGLALLGTSLSPSAVPGPLVFVGVLLWICLVWLPQVRPHQSARGSVLALLALLVLPVFYGLGRDALARVDVTGLNPLRAVQALLPADPRELELLARAAGEGNPEDRGVSSLRAAHPEGASRPLDARLLARADWEHQLRGMRFLLLLGMGYGLAAVAFLHLAQVRARS